MAITPIHPGEHLAEELKALNMSAAQLARNLGVPTNRVTQILNGTRSITGDTAPSARAFLWHKPAVLAQSAGALRAENCPEKGREVSKIVA